jgi:site-specific recombinase XerD
MQRRSPGRRTAIDYVSDVRLFAAACSRPWREVTMQDVDAFVDQQRQQGRSPATVKRRVAALKVFFDFLAEESGDPGWPNPVHFQRHAGRQPQRLPRDLSDREVEQLLTVITAPRDRAWFVLMLRAGVRVGEVVVLTLDDILAAPTLDQPARLRVCGKGQKERIVLLSAEAYAVLEAWISVRPSAVCRQVFLNDRGQPLAANGIEWLLHGYGAQVGLAVTPHQLRHTYARQMTEGGMPITSLSKLMGHAQITTTLIYTAGADPQLAQAYQAAIHRVTLPAPPISPPTHHETVSTPSPALPSPPVPALPDWEAWATYLPDGLRQVSLALVQQRLPSWKERRRRTQSLRLLGELRRFWDWLLTRRPVLTVAEIRLGDFQAYQDDPTLSGTTPSTRDHTLTCVLSALRLAQERGHTIDPRVFRLHPRPRPDSLPRHLSESESHRLESYMRSRLTATAPAQRLENACFFVLAHCGLRAAECLDLQCQDLDLAGGRLRIRQAKGQRDRIVYLSATAAHALCAYLEGKTLAPTTPLFLYPDGQPIGYAWLWAHTRTLGELAGVADVTPHRLRHTLATQLLNAGMDITRIQKLLGHRHVDTTLIYARVSDRTVEDDYRQAMAHAERQHPPLSSAPLLAVGWPMRQPAVCEPAEALGDITT